MSQPDEFDALQNREAEDDRSPDVCTGEGIEVSAEPADGKEERAADAVQGGSPYNNDPYQGNSPYYGNPQGGNPYNSDPHQGSGPYYSNPNGNSPHDNAPYGSNAYYDNRQNGRPGQGNTPYGHDPYSPYAVPTKKNSTGLLIGIVVVIIILFLAAVAALTYKVVSLYSEQKARGRREAEEYEFRDDRETGRRERRGEETGPDDNDGGYEPFEDPYYNDYFDPYYDPYHDEYYDPYDDYFGEHYGSHNYDDDWYGGGQDDGQYYTLQDDVKSGLSYSVEFEQYDYDADAENVRIEVRYPVIRGEHVPNLEQLNKAIAEEADLFKEYYEEEYVDYMDGENSYYSGISTGYVTYMDEEKLSIVFSEYLYTDYYNEVFLYSINIDIENGVVLDNENMLSIDDAFSVEFRKRSDVQNGEIAYLTGMTDQEITDYFNSSNIIVFYTPMGMEIGFNYEAGWVTVTYEEYEAYLKVF